jgi:HK97 family phage portal protein
MTWLVFWGNAFIWQPPGLRELLILPASRTFPVFKPSGDRWFRTTWANGEPEDLPDNEILHLMINSPDGIYGRSVITYAAETIAKQMGAHKTQAKFYKQGMNASGILWSSGELDKTARNRVRDEFETAASGSDNAYRVVVADNKFTKFEPISMKAQDMQFLQLLQATDQEIANYFGLPLYKLNSGKQAYNSNEQQNLDYLSTTLDPYLVQWEQGAAACWLPQQDQGTEFCRFNRDVILRTDARTRASVLAKKVTSGLLSPNEARQIEDMGTFPGGDRYFFPQNMQAIDGGKPNGPGN